MATEDDKIIINPYSKGVDSDAVAKNEAARLYMKNNNFQPEFKVTPEQYEYFKGTPYEGKDKYIKQTLIARILSGDPSAGMATPEQKKVADTLRKKLESTGTPKGSDNVVEQATKQYPILQKLNIKYSHRPSDKMGGLEFWPENEEGNKEWSRPKEIPLGSIGVEIRQKDKVRPIDVLGDVVSHHLVYKDPTLKKYYNTFLNSLTDDQKNKLNKDYEYAKKNFGEKRPFKQWAEVSRLPGYFRAYTFDQWPDEYNKKVFTSDQIKLFDEVKKYVGITK